MVFEKLRIARTWKGDVAGEIGFKNELGEITLKLDDAACQKMLEFCAESLVRVSTEAAHELKASCISSTAHLVDAAGSNPLPMPEPERRA